MLRIATDEHPIVVLTGARQVGKSTLLQNAEPFKSWRLMTLDDFDTRRQAQEKPDALWAGADHVVVDEIQKSPELMTEVKQAVDRAPRQRRFILSGSANLLLMQHVSESLAGRAVYLELAPMTLGEIGRSGPPEILSRVLIGDWPDEAELDNSPPDSIPIMLRGLMPALLSLSGPQSWIRWWDGYVLTYLERDLRQLSRIDSLVDFRRVMELAALRTGQIVNQSELARDAHLSQSTVHRYLNLLEASHLFVRLPAYTRSRTARLVKSPKAMWTDPGLAVFLSGYYSEDDLRQARELGCFFEAMVFHHLQVLGSMLTPAARLYYWRTRSGEEVDLVIEHGRRALAIEVKRASRPSYRDASGLRAFLKENPEASGGLLIHCGREICRLDERIVALPWTMLT
jgi:predicted AAA+ superfamily ATPase